MSRALLDLATASRIIDAALTESRRRQGAPLCVAVLASSGHLLALKREEAAAFYRIEIAMAKAAGCIGMGCGGRELMRRASAMPTLYAAFGSLVPLLPIAGGVLIRDAQAALLGAIGISGDTADHDESCGLAGIAAADLIADTGMPRP